MQELGPERVRLDVAARAAVGVAGQAVARRHQREDGETVEAGQELLLGLVAVEIEAQLAGPVVGLGVAAHDRRTQGLERRAGDLAEPLDQRVPVVPFAGADAQEDVAELRLEARFGPIARIPVKPHSHAPCRDATGSWCIPSVSVVSSPGGHLECAGDPPR
jgi:hypothetical protein